jgi:hypothetical protein
MKLDDIRNTGDTEFAMGQRHSSHRAHAATAFASGLVCTLVQQPTFGGVAALGP